MQTRSALPFGTRVVTAAFLAQALAVGLPMSGYPVFMESLETDLGATRTQTSLGISLIILAGALLGPLIGKAIDSGWARRVMVTGALLLALGFWSISRAPGLGVATLLWVGLVGPGFAMMGPHPATSVLARWFVERRGRVVAVAAMGTTLGGAVAPILAQALIDDYDWRTAIAGFGILAAAIGLPTIFFGILDSPESIGTHPDGASTPPELEAEERAAAQGSESVSVFFRDPRLWLIAVGFGLMTGASVGYLTHVVEWAQESGLDRSAAVRLIVVNSLFASLGKLLFGVLTDRFGPRNASLVAIGFELAGWSLMLSADSTWSFTMGGALYGLGLGCIIPCQAGYVGSIWGRGRFGQAAGLVGLLSIFGPFLIPISLGLGFDHFGSYEWPMLAMGGVIALSAVAFALVRPSPAR